MKKFSIIILSLILGLSGCKSKIGNISEVKKQVVFPGVSQGKIYMKYSAKIELFKPVKISSVKIITVENEIPVTDFSITDLKTGKILKNDMEIPTGMFFFNTDLEKTPDLEKDGDYLQINIQNGEKTETFKIAVVKGQPIMHR
jgi:hypothetical protein